MGNIGWFILGYLVTGAIANIVVTLGLVIVVALKDVKRNMKAKSIDEEAPEKFEHLNALHDAMADVEELAGSMFSEDKNTSILITYLRGLIIWPVALPKGIMMLFDAVKNR